jgi:acetylornithine deacetylase
MNIFELTENLIKLKSPTDSEADIRNFLREYLQNIGLKVRLQKVTNGRHNIYAASGNPLITLSTHMDTVSPYLPYSADEEYIFGRGACDAKGIMAAQIKAAEELLKEGNQNFGLLFVVGEEGYSDGARTANMVTNSSQYLINGEPTENKLAVGSKGSLRVKLMSEGISGHSAYPECGESAIEKLLDVLQDLRYYDYPQDKILGMTTLNIGVLKGGTQANVIPDYAEAILMYRLVSRTPDVKNLVHQLISGRCQAEILYECEPQKFETLDGFETMVASYTTDIPNLTNWGQPLLIGPGNIFDAHTLREKIKKTELKDAVGIYKNLVLRLHKMC